MTNRPPDYCLLCHAPTEPGWLIDLGESNRRGEQAWAAGEPRRSFLVGLKKPEKSFQVRAYRCTACGFLMEFANPDTER